MSLLVFSCKTQLNKRWLVANPLALECKWGNGENMCNILQSYFYLFIFFLLGLHLQYLEVPRLGVESEL